ELPAYSEADLDSGGRIDLTDLVQVPVPVDGDGSEVVSLLLTGLPPGFTLAGASPLNSGATGEAREWSLSLSQLANAQIRAPANFSGEVTFQVAGITTEQAGGSTLTMPPVDIGFRVTPSADGIANDGNAS